MEFVEIVILLGVGGLFCGLSEGAFVALLLLSGLVILLLIIGTILSLVVVPITPIIGFLVGLVIIASFIRSMVNPK